eukprot:12759892-Alexandrium_andersonii.AAC.1
MPAKSQPEKRRAPAARPAHPAHDLLRQIEATDPLARPHHPAAAALAREQTGRVGAPRAALRLARR